MRSFLLSAGVLLVLAAAARADDPPPLVTKVFSVADLVTPIPDFAPSGGGPGGGAAARLSPAERFKTPTADERAETFIRQVTTMVRPQSWQAAGGDGTADYFDLGSALVVKNSPEVVAEVGAYLAGLRRLQDVSVSTEVRVVSVPAGFSARVGLSGEAAGPVCLSDRETRLLMEAAQGHPAATVMQCPKLTTFDGQVATVDCADRVATPAGVVEVGDRLTLCGRVSADRRFVSLKVHAVRTALGGKKGEAEAAAVVPDGGTLVVGSWGVKGGATATEFGPPALSRVPYVNRLFKNVAIMPDREVIVLATPRIILAAEEPVSVAPMPREVPAAEEVLVQMLVAEVSDGFVRAAGLEPAAGAWALPAGSAAKLNLCLREEKARNTADILSRTMLCVVAGQTGSMQVGQDGGPGVCARVTPRVAPAGGVLLRVESQVVYAAAGGAKNVESGETTGLVPAGGTFITRGATRQEGAKLVETLFFFTPVRGTTGAGK